MKRRDFITLIGGAAAWPLAARAQQPRIGFLSGRPLDASFEPMVAAFRRGLQISGYIEGQNVAIEYRASEGYHQLPSLARELIDHQVTVLVTTGGPAAALAAKAVSSAVPIVFVSGFDAVMAGLVPNLNRPGGNVTGVSFLTTALEQKRIELIRELVPSAQVLAFLINPKSPSAAAQLRDGHEAARAIAKDLHILNASNQRELDTAFSVLAQTGAQALIVAADAFFTSRASQLATLSVRTSLPAIYHSREIAAAGGLMSYGASVAGAHRDAGVYVGRILKGERPGELPVLQPTRFELIINLKTAKALGLAVPDTLLARADEVIE